MCWATKNVLDQQTQRSGWPANLVGQPGESEEPQQASQSEVAPCTNRPNDTIKGEKEAFWPLFPTAFRIIPIFSWVGIAIVYTRGRKQTASNPTKKIILIDTRKQPKSRKARIIVARPAPRCSTAQFCSRSSDFLFGARARFLIVRDPAERLVSAFLNKCVTDGYMR